MIIINRLFEEYRKFLMTKSKKMMMTILINQDKEVNQKNRKLKDEKNEKNSSSSKFDENCNHCNKHDHKKNQY